MELSTFEERIQNARLTIHQPDGKILHFGHTGPIIDWHIHTAGTLADIIKHPELKLGTSYVNGEWDTDRQHLADLIGMLVPRTTRAGFFRNRPCLRRLRARLPHPRQSTAEPQWSEDNPWLSRQCLGNELLQICSYYSEPGVSSEQARRTAVQRLKNGLQLHSGQHLLDLNAGWGALAIQLAEQTGVRVTAVVARREQLQLAHAEVRRRGLDGQVHVRLGSFHQCRGRFDRVLANGFFEQYPEPSYPALFAHLESMLCDDGLAWIQMTGRSSATGLSHAWHRRQLPGRCSLPMVSDLVDGMESTGLNALTFEDQSSHRLLDLKTQARRFQRSRNTISQRFGEHNTRHWEFLLASQIAAFDWGQLRQYEFILGASQTHWPLQVSRNSTNEPGLPIEFARKIPGLARDI